MKSTHLSVTTTPAPAPGTTNRLDMISWMLIPHVIHVILRRSAVPLECLRVGQPYAALCCAVLGALALETPRMNVREGWSWALSPASLEVADKARHRKISSLTTAPSRKQQ
mmetsp:Transcript_50051/g.125555  ORF Transcript_50051/g.125555 Transcript_50051/m.125555 type:complete len:111 (-) Transcript_50051:87-419(-)